MNDNGKLRVVLATHNAGKIRELADPMADFGIEVVGLSLFPEIGEIEETGTTFEENALIKARAVCAATGLVAVADDSGLEVDALDKGPGVYSARYSNDWESLPGESVDQRNMRKLLFELRDVPQARRSCRFVSCMVAVHPDGRELVVRGTWEGRILEEPLGENGFGYDPLFWDESIRKSAAQLTRDEKIAAMPCVPCWPAGPASWPGNRLHRDMTGGLGAGKRRVPAPGRRKAPWPGR